MTGYDYSHPRRLHINTLVYRLISSSPGYLIPLYFGIKNQDMFEWTFIIIAGIIAIMSLPVTILAYYYFTYYINDRELIIHSGILAKNQRNIPLARVQNVDISQNFLQRILKIAKVKVETAGGSETEGLLEFVSVADSEIIRDLLKKRAKEQTELKQDEITDYNFESNMDPVSLPFEQTTQKLLFSMSYVDLLKYGMLTFRPVMLVFMAWAFQTAQQFAFLPDFDEMDSESIAGYIEQYPLEEAILYIVIATVIILILSWLFNILLSVNKYWKFNIKQDDDKLLSEYGLLNKRKGSIPLKKLQMLVIKTNPVRNFFGFFGLDMETAGIGEKNKGAETAVPFAVKEKVFPLAELLTNAIIPDDFIPVSRKTIRRAFIRYSLWVIIISFAAFWFYTWAITLLGLLPLVYYFAYIRWKYRGYRFSEDFIYIKQGFLSRRISVVPIKKIQTLNIFRTFFQRRLGLSTLHIDTAATSLTGDATIIDIDSDDAVIMMEDINSRFKQKQAL